MHDLGDGVDMLGFQDVLVNVDRIREGYADAFELLRNLREIGASNAFRRDGKGLGSRRVLERMKEIYGEKFVGERGVFATYEILFARGVKGG